MLATMTLARAGGAVHTHVQKQKAAHRIGEQPEVGRVTRNVGRIPLENPSRSRCDPSKAYWRSLRSALLVTRAGRIGVMVDVALAIAIFALLQVIACTLLSNAALTPTGPWPALCCRGCLREPCLRLLTQLLVRAGRIGVRQALSTESLSGMFHSRQRQSAPVEASALAGGNTVFHYPSHRSNSDNVPFIVHNYFRLNSKISERLNRI